MNLPGQKTWSAGTCKGQVGPRSYEVKVGKSVYQRNHRQLVLSKEPPIPDVTEPESLTPETTRQPPQAEPLTQAPNNPMSEEQPASQSLRRSQRIRKPPARLSDFVTQ